MVLAVSIFFFISGNRGIISNLKASFIIYTLLLLLGVPATATIFYFILKNKKNY